MKRAVELAAKNAQEGGRPFAAVLMKDDKIVAEGANELHKKYDISGHAGITTIRKAQEELKTLNLSGYTMFTSSYPCPMCLEAIKFSGITDIYYCESSAENPVESYENMLESGADKELVMKKIFFGEHKYTGRNSQDEVEKILFF